MKSKDIFIHKSAVVDQGAVIGKGTYVWHFSHILKKAKIGENCRIGQNVVVHSTAVIGSNVKIQNNVSVYDGVVLEDDVFCGPSCVFTNVINPRARCPQNTPEHYKGTLVKKGATIGANATILCGIVIGRHSFVGAGSVVTQEISDYALVYGNPARFKGWMCECGNKIRFKGNRTRCLSCGRRYLLNKGKVDKMDSRKDD